MSHYSNHLFTPGSNNNSWSHLYEYINNGDRVLDVGCSSGHFGEALIQLKGCKVTGIDLDVDDIASAKKVLTEAYVMNVDDMKNMVSLGKFDVIIFADVIEHLIDPRQTLKNMRKLLKKDGRIIFSIPHMGHVSVRLDLLGGEFAYRDKGLLDRTHLHFYDSKEVQDVFSDSGYVINKIDPVVSEYPTKIIDNKLSKLGLKSSTAFIEKLKGSNADIFQFIGYATISDGQNTKTTKARTKYTMPQDEIMAYSKAVLRENRRLWEKEQKLHTRNVELERQLESYLRLRKWFKFLKPIKRIVNR